MGKDGRMDEDVKVPGQEAFQQQGDKSKSTEESSRSRGPRRTPFFWLGLALLLAAVAAAGWWRWDSAHQAPPQILTLSDGSKYQFIGTTYGVNNVPPMLKARLVRVLPRPLADWVRKHVGQDFTQYNEGERLETPQLFLWFKQWATNSSTGVPGPPLVARLTDDAGMEAGLPAYVSFASSVAWSYAAFPVVPKRSRMLECDLYLMIGPGNLTIPRARFTFPNPVYGHFPQWKPEPVPAVKRTGDLEVRLDEFNTGTENAGGYVVHANGSRGLPREAATKGQNTKTIFDFSFSSPRGTNEVWAPQSAELSDATGNVLVAKAFRGGLQSAHSESIRGTLWPDEAAWRLKLEVKRAGGYAPEEMVTFSNVPVPAVGKSNTTAITKLAGGIPIALTEFEHKPDITVNMGGLYDMTSRVRVELPGKPAGVAIDFLNMTAEAGAAEQYGSSTPDFGYEVLLKSIPANAKTMTFTFVVQKTRSVEFLVPPSKPP
jgi:hypothetical protein